jgi:hypothetical protein
MSHKDYVDKCDEEQLEALIVAAKGRMKQLQESGWVPLWVVAVGWSNIAWYPADQHPEAVQRACREVGAYVARWPGQKVEMEVSIVRYRPDEAKELLTRMAAKGSAADGAVP